jgi:hypothetical protein
MPRDPVCGMEIDEGRGGGHPGVALPESEEKSKSAPASGSPIRTRSASSGGRAR